MSQATIRIRTGPLKGQKIALRHGKTRIGRDSDCEISPAGYHNLSRVHACLTWDNNGFTIEDLGSSNGMFVEGQRVARCRLAPGQTFQVGDFVAQLSLPPTPPRVEEASHRQGPAAQAVGPTSAVRLTQMFPVLTKKRSHTERLLLVPGIITVVAVVAMFNSVLKPEWFNLSLALYLAGMSLFFVYYLCETPKPWWLLGGAALMTALVVTSPIFSAIAFVFRDVLPGTDVPGEPLSASFVHYFFGAGLCEEFTKALPVLLACYCGVRLSPPYREQVGVWGPLDGILLGAASAVGFTLIETMGQYVPNAIQTFQDPGTGQLAGVELLIPRILSTVTGHMAWSGYFGYFIGLSVLRPKARWQLLGTGYLTAAVLHGMWDALATTVLFQLVIAMASYAFLVKAIFKAREMAGIRNTNYTPSGGR